MVEMVTKGTTVHQGYPITDGWCFSFNNTDIYSAVKTPHRYSRCIQLQESVVIETIISTVLLHLNRPMHSDISCHSKHIFLSVCHRTERSCLKNSTSTENNNILLTFDPLKPCAPARMLFKRDNVNTVTGLRHSILYFTYDFTKSPIWSLSETRMCRPDE